MVTGDDDVAPGAGDVMSIHSFADIGVSVVPTMLDTPRVFRAATWTRYAWRFVRPVNSYVSWSTGTVTGGPPWMLTSHDEIAGYSGVATAAGAQVTVMVRSPATAEVMTGAWGSRPASTVTGSLVVVLPATSVATTVSVCTPGVNVTFP